MKRQVQLLYIMWFAIAIQNSFLLAYKIAGLEITDILVIFSIGCILVFHKNEYPTRRYTVLFLMYIIFLSLYGWICGSSLYNVIRDIRNYVFLIFSYVIFSQIGTSWHTVEPIFIYSGLINSIVYIFASSFFSIRDVSTILLVSVVSCTMIMLSRSPQPLHYYFIAALNIVVIFASQTRTLIIPVLVCLALIILRNLSQLRVGKILLIVFSSLIVLYILQYFGLLEYVIERFQRDNIVGETSTLTLRIESALLNFKKMSFFDWLFGVGFGKEIQYYHNFWGSDMMAISTNLEMFVPNYIMKLGLVGFGVMTVWVVCRICISFKVNYSHYKKNTLLVVICVFSGGFISGLCGPEASIILGTLFGLSCNNNIYSENECELYEHSGETVRKLR